MDGVRQLLDIRSHDVGSKGSGLSNGGPGPTPEWSRAGRHLPRLGSRGPWGGNKDAKGRLGVTSELVGCADMLAPGASCVSSKQACR